MALSGKQKAAMLLMSLDAPTAAELLKGVEPAMVQELAVEVAYLEVSGLGNSLQNTEVARQFYKSLESSKKFDIQNFLGTMLKSAIGQEKAERIQTQIQDLLQKRDPFIPIRSANSQALAAILAKEHPQAAAVVLSELPPKKSSEILAIFEEQFRFKVVTRMTMIESVSLEAKMRIAQMVCGHLESTPAAQAAAPGKSDQASRKIAVMLRNLSKEIRDGLLTSITQKDAEAGKIISDLMLIWEDIVEITDRSLQTALRGIDAKTMAMAFINADETIVRKIKTNISERAAATIEEEASLLSSPKKADIEQAREDMVNVLREINQKGELNFIEE